MLNLFKRMAGKSTLALVTTILGWAVFGLLFWKSPGTLDLFQDYCSDFTVWAARKVDRMLGLGGQTKIVVKSFNLGNMLMITLLIFFPRVIFWLLGEMHRLSAPSQAKPRRVNM